MKKSSFTANVGDAFIPKNKRRTIGTYFRKAGIKQIPYKTIGYSVYYLLFFSSLSSLVLIFSGIMQNIPFFLWPVLMLLTTLLVFPLLSMLFMVAVRIYLDARIHRRIMQMEEILPEFLSELSLNLKAGLTLDKALQNSVEKEFGVLEDEINEVVKQIQLGKDTDKAITGVISMYDSDILQESFQLIITSWKKGVSTPPLIDRLVDNLNEQQYLRRKVVASVSSYKIFLSVVTLVITPAMFALAFHLIKLLQSIFDQILRVSENIILPININPVLINDSQFILFSYIGLVIMTICSSMISSIINSGSAKDSYKQSILYSVVAVLLYRIFLTIFASFFSWFSI